jgi:hypothetical protein
MTLAQSARNHLNNWEAVLMMFLGIVGVVSCNSRAGFVAIYEQSSED